MVKMVTQPQLRNNQPQGWGLSSYKVLALLRFTPASPLATFTNTKQEYRKNTTVQMFGNSIVLFMLLLLCVSLTMAHRSTYHECIAIEATPINPTPSEYSKNAILSREL